MDRVTEFRPTPQMLWINILPGKRPDEAMSGAGMLARRCNRKEAEEKLQQSYEYLSLGQRLRYTGTSGWSVLRTGIFWSDETFLVCEYNRPKRRPGSLRGRMDAENVAALEMLFSSGANGRRIVLRLKDLTLVDRHSISFLLRCKADSTSSRIPRYTFHEWMEREKMNACAALKQARILGKLAPRFDECACEANERVSVSEQSGTLPERPSAAGRNNRRCPS
jgi:hypothetical protein